MPRVDCPVCGMHSNFKKDNEKALCMKCDTNLYDYFYRGKDEAESNKLIRESLEKRKRENEEKERLREKERNEIDMEFKKERFANLLKTTFGGILSLAFVLFMFAMIQHFDFSKVAKQISVVLEEYEKRMNPKLSELTCEKIAKRYVGNTFSSVISLLEKEFKILSIDSSIESKRNDREIICQVRVFTTDGDKKGEFVARSDGKQVFYYATLR